MLGQKGIPTAFGGIERHVEELSCRLAENGHDVFVYCRPWYLALLKDKENWQNKEQTNKPIILQTPTIKSKNLDAIVHTFTSTIHAIFKIKPDVYHYHGVGPSLISFIPRIFCPRAKVITTFHCIDRKHQKWSLPARLMLRLGEWASCKFAHATITVSRTLEQYCQDVYETKTQYIPNGVTTPNRLDASLIKRFGLEKDNYIAMISRLVRHKGAHYLIGAWQALKAENPDLIRDLKLAIVGDSAFTDDYVAEIKKLAMGDESIVFTGYQSGAMLDELFTNSLFIVHPSESEGLPIAVLEAMSYGKTVLASDIPENLEIVAEHGFHFENKNIDDLKNKLAVLIEAKDKLIKIGVEARDFVLASYGWNDIVKETENLYKKVYKLGYRVEVSD